MVIHNIPPVYTPDSEILILGSFPSVKSREAEFFYAHPQNRFWKVIAGLNGDPVPGCVAEKKALLNKNRIAVWDVIGSCEIKGSDDSTITDVVPNDIGFLLNGTSIKKIFVNGRRAEKCYRDFMLSETGIKAIYLPSTSPANASSSLSALIENWKRIISES